MTTTTTPRRVAFTRVSQSEHSTLRGMPRVPFTRASQTELGTLRATPRRTKAHHSGTAQITKMRPAQITKAGAAQITHSYPAVSNYSEPGEIEMLARVVRDARRARGKRHTLRKPTAPARIGDTDRWERMRKHLRRLARRALNDLAKGEHPMPTPDALAGALAAYVWAECSHMVHEQAPGESRLSSRERVTILDGAEAVERVSGNAARYALRDPSEPARHVAENRRRASLGGSNSKRRHEWERDPGKLDALAALDGLTVAEQAERLDKSPATVKRMRKALRDRDA